MSTDPKIRLVLLWHMHQPYYKDLVMGAYRLPWVRLHALKDYYGMVAMLEEFPQIHQTFNLVPSLLLQLEDYASGNAKEAVQDAAFKPANQLNYQDRLFVLQYFFQANLDNVISRFPRYRQLYDRMQANHFVPARALPFFRENDITDLQVLSQLAWWDELFLEQDADLRALAAKGQGYSYADQQLLRLKQQGAIRKVLEAYRAAADRGKLRFPRRRSITRSCRCCVTRMSPPKLTLGSGCRSGASGDPKTPASSWSARFNCTNVSSAAGQRGFGRRRGPFPPRS